MSAATNRAESIGWCDALITPTDRIPTQRCASCVDWVRRGQELKDVKFSERDKRTAVER